MAGDCKLQLPLGAECITIRSGRDSELSVTDRGGEDYWDPEAEKSSYTNLTNDTLFQEIRDHVDAGPRRGSFSTIHSEGGNDDGEEYGTKTSDDFTSVPYGLQPRAAYEHSKKNTDIIGISYNGRMRQFIILDAKGITIWKKDLIDHNVDRALLYPKFEYRLITNLVYAKKHNVYFALGKDFSLKVLNRDFEETCRVDSDLRSVLFMIFNPIRDELITGGVGGTKIWRYHQVAEKTWTEIKPMANYRLKLQYELPNVGGSWVKRVELDLVQQHLYCCSDTDLYAYNMDGQEIFRFPRAHNMSITGCVFSVESNLLVTASVDTEVKAWSLGGGLVHIFRGHSRAVTSLMLHPDTSAIIMTSSLDGSIRIWSLHTMEALYSLVVSTDGVLWMGLTDDRLLYLSTMRAITIWALNTTSTFWAATRSKVLALGLVSGEDKSTRVLAKSQDNSLRIFCVKTCKNLSTVLPPPTLSPLESMLDVTYNRIVNVIYVLINTREIWLYTVRTDPACLVTVWNTLEIQEQIIKDDQATVAEAATSRKKSGSSGANKRGLSHRASQYGQGNELVSDCRCVCYLNAYVMMFTDEGPCTPIQNNYLLLGLEDGRILFMDPIIKAKKYFQFRASKDAIVSIQHDLEHSCLWTQCDLGDARVIQIWLLPQLELRHEVFCPPDLTGCVRLDRSFITSHTSGSVIHHVLQDIDDMAQSVYRPRFALNDDGSESSFVDLGKADHAGPVCAINACHNLGIFCTASSDGTVKIWESSKILLTEITLDKTLSSAAFLNNRGDLIIGFKNHIFHIEHSKVCPTLKCDAQSEEEYAESEIHEDPAILFESVQRNPDPLDLKNYLVPFNIDFSQDFLEGRKLVEDVKEELPEELSDDTSSVLSAAPTLIYESPRGSPTHLSKIDLTLSDQVTPYDLNLQMRQMLHKHRFGRHKTNVKFDDSQDEDDISAELAYELPQFGISPGPSPTPSPPSTIATPSDFDVSSGGESTPVDTEDEEEAKTSFKPIQAPSEATPAEKVVTPKPSLPQPPATAKPIASRLDNIRIDSKTLIKQNHKTMEKTRPPDPPVPEVETVEKLIQPRPPAREVKRKTVSANRKRPQTRSSTTKPVSGHADSDDDEGSVSRAPRARTSMSSQAPTVKKRSKPNVPRIKEEKTDDLQSPKSDVVKRAPPAPVRRPDVKHTTKASSKRTPIDVPKLVAPTGDSGPSSHKIKHKRSRSSRNKLAKQRSKRCQKMASTEKSHDRSCAIKIDSTGDLPIVSYLKYNESKEGNNRPPDTEDRSGTSLSQLKVGFCEDLLSDVSDTESKDRLPESGTLRAALGSPTDKLYTRDVISPVGGSTRDRDGATSGAANEADGAVDNTVGGATGTVNDTPGRVDEASLRAGAVSITDDHLLHPDTGERVGRVVTGSDAAMVSRSDASLTRDNQSQALESHSRSSLAVSRASHQRPASPTMTIISDYGSEWTVAPPDDVIRIDDPLHAGKEGAVPGWYRATMSAVSTRRRYTQSAEPRTPRPHTALVLPTDTEELETMYQTALNQYESEGNSDPFNRNNGTKFENYHDTLIERHQLLRMQKELRLKSAQARRHQMSLQQHERNEVILQRSASSMGRVKSRPDSAFTLFDRSNTTSPTHAPAVVPTVWISTRGSPDNRNQSAPSGNQAGNQGNQAGNQYCSLHEEWNKSGSPPGCRPTTGPRSGKVSPRSAQRLTKTQLGNERPFRSRLRPQTGEIQVTKPSTDTERIDLQLLDPRNPAALKYPSSKSIPSKCTRYVLIANNHDNNDRIIPTPLEEQLIVERFPQKMDKWLTGYPRSPRTYHGFPTSYLKALALERKAVMHEYVATTNKVR